MGLYDNISVFQRCPVCNEYQMFDAQTKDLGQHMYNYDILDPDWEKGYLQKSFRKKLPVFKRFHLDKSNKVWKSQAERREAAATIPKEFNKLKYINVIADCNSIQCQFDADRRDIINQGSPSGFGRSFRGKIKIKNGMLVGPIYDIELDNLKEKELNKYKTIYKKKFDKLMKKYKHEPIVCRNWRG